MFQIKCVVFKANVGQSIYHSAVHVVCDDSASALASGWLGTAALAVHFGALVAHLSVRAAHLNVLAVGSLYPP